VQAAGQLAQVRERDRLVASRVSSVWVLSRLVSPPKGDIRVKSSEWSNSEK
jgi:hypothetical protein